MTFQFFQPSRLPWFVLLMLAGILVFGSNAWSDDKTAAREREALRRVQQQVQQLRQEKTVLDGKFAVIEKEKNDLALEKDKLSSQVGGALARAKAEGTKGLQLQAALDAANQEKQALQTQKTGLEEQLAALTTKQAKTESELTQAHAQIKQLDTNLQARTQQVASCEGKNDKLYQHGRDLIAQCQDKSATDVLLRLEPLTGIQRVGIENLLEEYRDKLDAQKK